MGVILKRCTGNSLWITMWRTMFPRSRPHIRGKLPKVQSIYGPYKYMYAQIIWIHAVTWPPGGAFGTIFPVLSYWRSIYWYLHLCSGPITPFVLKYDLYYDRIYPVVKYLGCYWVGTPSRVMWCTHISVVRKRRRTAISPATHAQCAVYFFKILCIPRLPA